jgi:hypothetical protein
MSRPPSHRLSCVHFVPFVFKEFPLAFGSGLTYPFVQVITALAKRLQFLQPNHFQQS